MLNAIKSICEPKTYNKHRNIPICPTLGKVIRKLRMLKQKKCLLEKPDEIRWKTHNTRLNRTLQCGRNNNGSPFLWWPSSGTSLAGCSACMSTAWMFISANCSDAVWNQCTSDLLLFQESRAFQKALNQEYPVYTITLSFNPQLQDQAQSHSLERQVKLCFL